MESTVDHRACMYVYSFIMGLGASSVVACSFYPDKLTPHAPKTFFEGHSDQHEDEQVGEYCQDLPIPYALPYRELAQNHHYLIRSAIEKWEVAVGKNLFEEVEFNGVLEEDLEEGYKNNVLEFRFPHASKNKVPPSAAAIARYRVTYDGMTLESDVWYNTAAEYEWGDIRRQQTQQEGYDEELQEEESQGEEAEEGVAGLEWISDIELVTLHELGHVLGLDHVTRHKDVGSVMRVDLQPMEEERRYPSLGDIARVQVHCGCEGEACNHRSTLRRLQNMP